jgi:hypothetical protein
MVFFVNANEAWKIIVFDTILGFVSFIIYHYKKGDFSKLIK